MTFLLLRLENNRFQQKLKNSVLERLFFVDYDYLSALWLLTEMKWTHFSLFTGSLPSNVNSGETSRDFLEEAKRSKELRQDKEYVVVDMEKERLLETDLLPRYIVW